MMLFSFAGKKGERCFPTADKHLAAAVRSRTQPRFPWLPMFQGHRIFPFSSSWAPTECMGAAATSSVPRAPTDTLGAGQQAPPWTWMLSSKTACSLGLLASRSCCVLQPLFRIQQISLCKTHNSQGLIPLT